MNISNAVFLGSKKLGLEVFKSLYAADPIINWTILCPPDLNDLRTNYDDFVEFAKKEGLDLLTANSPNMVEQFVKDHKTDVMIVCGYDRILPPSLFDYVEHGIFGIHNSLLPKYRGGSPLVWQLINGEEEIGSSFFKFDKGIDDGPILDQVKFKNADNLTIKDAINLIEKMWTEKIPTFWNKFCNGELSVKEQDHRQATYCAQRQEKDGLIDWTLNATKLDRFIRAQTTPYPKAYFRFENKILRIVEHQIDDRKVYGCHGQVYEVRKHYVAICCGDNSLLRLIKLEVDGKEINASDILTSFKLRLGL